MVFFFIAYLTIICLLCVPFTVKIYLFYSQKEGKFNYSVKIGFITLRSPHKQVRKSKKKKHKSLFSIKKIVIPKFLYFSFRLYLNRPHSWENFEKYLLGVPLIKAAKLIDRSFDNVSVFVQDDEMFYLDMSVTVTDNMFLIFSYLLQTITIGRRKWKH